MIKVYKYYQLMQDAGRYTTDNKKLIRDRVVIHESIADRANENCLNSGKLYVEDPEQTRAYKEACENRKKIMKEDRELKRKMAQAALSETINAALGKANSKKGGQE